MCVWPLSWLEGKGLAQLRSHLLCTRGLRHEGPQGNLPWQRPDVNSERPICGAEAGARESTLPAWTLCWVLVY